MNNKDLLPLIHKEIVKNNPEQLWVFDNLLLSHLGGSHLYGTNNPDSDIDVIGITIAPKDYWVGARKFESYRVTFNDPKIDVIIYDIRRWLSLAVAMNPNVIESIFVSRPNPCVLSWRCPEWGKISERVFPLLNQRAHVGYHGYATSQLKKMAIKQSNKTGRLEISDKFGYDTKFAMHGFRLARQGIELLRSGWIEFPRPDAANLLAIRNGEVFLGADDCIKAWQKEAQELDQALVDTILPAKCDFDKYNQLLMDTYEEYVR